MRAIKNKTAGFTLIEMLVGIVIGMIVVAAASVMMVTVLKSQKDITASARLNQESGAAMAVMSNEIRRAGFNVCDENNATLTCEDFDPYLLGEDIKIVGGTCIEYRYNADVDDDSVDPEEQRGFRLNDNIIEMAGTTGAVTCGNDANWVGLTNPTVIKITALSFSSAGSKCRNMTEDKERYWIVGADSIGVACDPATTPVVCTDLGGGCSPPLAESGDDLFGVHQIQITLKAELTKDSSVLKKFESSVKVANPWIGKIP